MAYATAADMVARFGDLEVIEITDRNGDGLIDEDVAAASVRAIVSAANSAHRETAKA